ncbi:NUDIX domain-containing protein [Acuticoccus sp. I52.16.1]|uniref:NUDIX hydrolase n=1 Tax=Acuticoccus sp. I52.16.1 TaxID=2928472 RepID=UPI001FD40FB6|nr:NUDIX domain-containing protein [Acuticoccus sp. I52.16.1]UOM35435.1 NUDIX domain-containing protein [Acuticoccus sp. I52.16.1]
MSEATAAERLKRDAAAGKAEGHRRVTIRDAATLILIDREGPSVLMGRRSMRHVFMPGRFVFPGGRVDPTDARVKLEATFDPATLGKLTTAMRSSHGEARARALGAAAIREVYEETGVLVGTKGAATLPNGPAWQAFRDRGIGLDFSALRYVFRAVTPPGRPRRFDTRFFAIPREAIAEIDPTRVGEDAELEEIAWVTLDEARKLELPGITHIVIDSLAERLAAGPDLAAGGDVPFFRMVRGERKMVVL